MIDFEKEYKELHKRLKHYQHTLNNFADTCRLASLSESSLDPDEVNLSRTMSIGVHLCKGEFERYFPGTEPSNEG